MFKIADVVMIHPMDADDYAPPAGVVESTYTDADGEVYYAVRSPYTGVLFGGAAEDFAAADTDTTAQVRQDMQHLDQTNYPECAVTRVCADGAVITEGMVAAEVARTDAAPRPTGVAPMRIVGVNASTNEYA